MKQFLKFMLAAMLGSLAVIALLVIITMAIVAGLSSSLGSQGTTAIKDGTVLHLTFEGDIVDQGRKDQFDLDLGIFQTRAPIGLNQVLASLEHAKTDDKIEGVFLDLSNVGAGFATLREIHKKLVEFREESGKPVIAFSDSYSQATYYLACAADEVYLQPKGDLMYMGLRTEYMFLKGMFEKLDVDIQFIRGSNNKFKSFGETYTEDQMSPANKEQTRSILDGLWAEHLAAVSAKTGRSAEELNAIAGELKVRNAAAALELGMVDGLKFRDEVLDHIRERMDLEAGKKIRMADLRRYRRSFTPRTKGRSEKGIRSKDKLAVIFAEGSIAMGRSSDGTIGSTSLSQTIREAREDSTVKAIVLRVNSPGGSGLASDVIWREVKLATEVKPVVVSMGNVAASGGYYIAAPAHRIFAEPNTITGSIGVFGIIPNMQGFFKNKLGITFDGVKTHEFADLMSLNRPLTEQERTIVQGYIDDFYGGFLERVAEGRNMSVAQVDSVGQGRVWTGKDALSLGLVDELGGLEDAIDAAAAMAELEDYRRVELPRQRDLFQQLMEDLGGEARAWAASTLLGDDVRTLKQFQRIRQVQAESGIMARMPFDLLIY